MDFKSVFSLWLDGCLGAQVPDRVRAFSFNLMEPADIPNVKFGIELIGAGTFDEDDPDWPTDEVWEPDERMLPIPLSFSGEKWDECLARTKSLILEYLSKNGLGSYKLTDVEAVGCGFVDGDLEVIWKAE